MVKTGRSKSGKGGKSKGPGSDRSGSAPPSPTRRLKKGGKRGRRLCHMDGCTLCPSFGFEGEVAVSCSHHKELGMRNLTARRCQHEGCFTVANFGMPGDKPGYCAAHSTAGMVNRNKPRGAEGMLAGVGIARSSRRATKANSALQGLRLGGGRGGGLNVGSVSTSDAVITRSSYHRAHYSGSPGTGSGSSGEIGDGGGIRGAHGVSDAQAKLQRCGERSNGRSRMPFGEGSCDGSRIGECGMESDRDSGLNVNGSKGKGTSSQHQMRPAGPPAPTADSSALFISRREDPPEPDIVPYGAGVSSGVNHIKRADLARGPGSAGRVRARGGGGVTGASAMTTSMQILQNPLAAVAHEAYLAVHRGGLKAAQMGQTVDSIMHRVGTSQSGMDAGFLGDSREGSGMMSSNKDMGLVGGNLIHSTPVGGNLDGPLGMDMSNGLESLLGPEHLNVEVVKDGGSTGDELVRTPRGINLARALRGSQELSCSSRVASFLSNGEHSRGMACRRESDVLSLSEGEGGEDFDDLVNLHGLDPMGLAALGNPSGGAEALARSLLASPTVTSAPTSISTSGSMGVTNLGVTSAGAIVSIAPSPSLQSSSTGRLTPSEGTQSSSAYNTALTATSTPLSEAPVSTPVALPATGGVMHTDEGWWDGFEGEEFVAMPEPWAVDLGNAGLVDDTSGRGQDESRAWRQGPLPLARGGGGTCLTGPLGGGGGDNDVIVGKDSKDFLQGMLLDHPNQLKSRGFLCSSPSLVGDSFSMEDVGFPTVEESKGRSDRAGCGSGGGGGAVGSPGFPMLSGGCRLSGDRGDLGDVEGVRLSPMKRRQGFPSVDTTDILSPAIHAGSALRDIKRDSGGNGSFLSSAHNGSYSPPARTFGSTVASAGPLASASQSQLINSSPTILGGSMLWQAMPTPGSNLSRGWGAGDPISPSKLLSASPTGGKVARQSLQRGPQSTSPWGGAGLHPPHRTQAAGRA